MTAAGQWVMVRPEVPITGGMHGTVIIAGKTGAVMLDFHDPRENFQTFGAHEITADVTMTREAYLRQRAALRLAHAEAAVVEARNGLRAAVKAEIAAMPTVADASTARGVRDALVTVLGATMWDEDAAFPEAGFACWHVGDGAITLHSADDGDPMLLSVSAPDGYMGSHDTVPITAHLDHALRAALCWLADRDVFLPTRAP